MKHTPPRWADRFLNWYCNPLIIEDIQGDAYELFERRCKTEGASIARRKFIWDVVRFFRWSNIKRSNSKYQTNQIPMFKNYLKVGFRNLSRNWVVSIINVFGLSLAVGCAITVFIFLDYQYNVDKFHSNYDRVYQVINYVEQEGELNRWGDSPLLLGPELATKHSEIKRVARIEYQRGNMRYGEDVFNETIVFTDPEMMHIFDYPLLYGDKSVLENKEQIIISKEKALKYFGDEDPLGKRLSVKFSNGKIVSFFVGGVFDEFPKTASFWFHIVAPIDNFFDLKIKDHYTWSDYTDATFVELHPGRDTEDLEAAMAPYVEFQNNTDTKWPIEKFEFWPLEILAINNHVIDGEIAGGSHPAGRAALSIMAGLLLILACFNYMNLAVAASTKRLKEIALRKVLGSARRGIINQFLIENVLLCFFALVLGTVLCYTLLLPGFNTMIPIVIPFGFSSFQTAALFFVVLLLLVGVASGAYPAFYISNFQPVHIFRGSQKFGGKNIFSKILLTFQFIIAFTTIIGSFVFTDNALYLKKKDWGYDQANIFSIPVLDKKTFDGLRDKAAQNPDIKSFSGGRGHIGRYDLQTRIDFLDNKVAIIDYRVGFDYLETMNIRLKEGRSFDRQTPSDLTESLIISESLVDKLNFEEPIGETVRIDSTDYRVIGVVGDFYYNSFYGDKLPTSFRLTPEEEFAYAVIKAAPGKVMEVDEYMKQSWIEIAPNDPYDRLFQNDVFLRFFEENQSNIIIISFVAGFAIILASIGLFGLLSFNITKRLKEFSIRKTLGADPLNLIKLANKEYVWILLIAFMVGAPLGYIGINSLIQSIYTDPQQAGSSPFIWALVIMLSTILVTVSGQVLKAIKVNPAQILRAE